MDVKQYYRKLREIETTMSEPYALVVSLETSDGGKAGMVSEVSREMAARTIVEGRGVIANEQEKQAYLERQTAGKKAALKAELAKRVHVAIISDPDLPAPAASTEK